MLRIILGLVLGTIVGIIICQLLYGEFTILGTLCVFAGAILGQLYDIKENING